MNRFWNAMANQAVSAVILLCTLIGGGTLAMYRLDKLEETDAKQVVKMEEIASTVTEIRISVASLEAKIDRDPNSIAIAKTD